MLRADISTLMPILLACLSYVFTTLHTLRSEQHRNLTTRVSQQLEVLYGPLLACINASKSSHEAMISQFTAVNPTCSASAFRDAVRGNPNSAEAAAYRLWVKAVLMPLSVTAADLVIKRADLLEGTTIEPLLLQLVAHVSACVGPALARLPPRPAGPCSVPRPTCSTAVSAPSYSRPTVRPPCRYKVILQQWDQGTTGEFSTIPYPEKIHQWVSREFGRLKRRQATLLGLGGGGLMRLASKL